MATVTLLALALQALTLPPFESVALSSGGQVTIRHGPAQSVTIRQGHAPIRVSGGRLVIEHCRRGCRRGERLAVEIVTPRLASATVSDGGLLRLLGRFPAQGALAASVSDGGALDLRALPARQVTASVAQGGIILVSPGERLTASVRQGGRISYWGAPVVQSAIQGGGVIERGTAADRDRPLADPHPALPPLPPIPASPSLRR
ncbi:MAG TPA: DUF2807 domain-containing protein [Allosphingosinicella sp.]|nr:DUF2807 domain-containing protein [Allosphingosinicella sp.]